VFDFAMRQLDDIAVLGRRHCWSSRDCPDRLAVEQTQQRQSKTTHSKRMPLKRALLEI